MRIDIHLHTGEGEHALLTQILAGIHKLQLGQGTIMATQAELETQLGAVADQLGKALAEVQAEIAKLGQTSPGVDAAMARLAAAAQALDDLNPDAPAP